MNNLQYDKLIIGIGGNINPPNPRLPAYILPAIQMATEKIKNQTELILVSSKYGTMEYSHNCNKERGLVNFNTDQKIKFIQDFIGVFYPNIFENIRIDYGQEQKNISKDIWLKLWGEIEKTFTLDESNYIEKVLSNFTKNNNLDGSKCYSVEHAFWFKDITQDDIFQNSKIASIGGQQESYFNLIREKVTQLGIENITEIISKPLILNQIDKIIIPTGGVIPYGGATRKKSKKRISIELEPENDGDIIEHYNSSYSVKSGLHIDIQNIKNSISKIIEGGTESYQDFWNDFSKNYTSDKINL